MIRCKHSPGTVGYATIRGRLHWCAVDRHNRKGVRVRFNAGDPSSCWEATDLATVKDFIANADIKPKAIPKFLRSIGLAVT